MELVHDRFKEPIPAQDDGFSSHLAIGELCLVFELERPVSHCSDIIDLRKQNKKRNQSDELLVSTIHEETLNDEPVLGL